MEEGKQGLRQWAGGNGRRIPWGCAFCGVEPDGLFGSRGFRPSRADRPAQAQFLQEGWVIVQAP